MTVTLLLDLDDTLLTNDIDQFMPAYLKLLSRQMAKFTPPEKTIRVLLAATQVMIGNHRPDQTLEETFDAAFYPALGFNKGMVHPDIEDFYARIFPALKPITAPRPEAARLVAYAMQKGHRLVLATNPLFPRTAIVQRLTWAGFPPEEYPFILIPSYDSFHFAKPEPAFFTELLGQIGWPNDPAIMVGNDPELDLIPAAKVGLSTFLVNGSKENVSHGDFKPDGAGTLDDLIAWLERETPPSKLLEADTQEALLAVLLGTPAALQTIVKPLSAEVVSRRPAPGEWSITEVVCHLRDVDQEINLPRMKRVLVEESAFLPGVVSDNWVDERHYSSQDCSQALQDFMKARIELLEILTNLSGVDWQRGTRHAIFGPTSLQELVGFIAAHDRNHLQQVAHNLRP